MGLMFQWNGSPLKSLQQKLQGLQSPSVAVTMSSDSDSALYIWAGDRPDKHTHVWITEGNGQELSSLSAFDMPNLLILAAKNVRSGLLPQMHAVQERAKQPIYFTNEQEMESYLAERLASIQEVF